MPGLAIDGTRSGDPTSIAVSVGEALHAAQLIVAAGVGLVIGTAGAATLARGGLAGNDVPPASGAQPFAVTLAAADEFSATGRQVVAISPDGSHIAYVAQPENLSARDRRSRRGANSLGTDAGGTNGARPKPFLLARRSMARVNWQAGEIRKVSIRGGSPVAALRRARVRSSQAGTRRTSFCSDREPTQAHGCPRLRAVRPKKVITVAAGERASRIRNCCPMGYSVLFTVGAAGSWDDARIVAQSDGANDRATEIPMVPVTRAMRRQGLLFARNGTLFGVSFDASAKDGQGVAAVPLVDGVADAAAPSGVSHFALSATGVLINAGTYLDDIGVPPRVMVCGSIPAGP